LGIRHWHHAERSSGPAADPVARPVSVARAVPRFVATALLASLACGISCPSWDQREDTHYRESAHFVAFYDGDDPWLLHHACLWAEEGFWAAAGLTHLPPPQRRILLVMYSNAKGWDIKAPDTDPVHVGGFVLPYHAPPPDAEGGVTIVIDASHEAGPTPETVRHEAAHAFVVGYLKEESSRLPWWLSEGIAQLAAGEDVAPPEALMQALREDRLLPLSHLDSPLVTLGMKRIEVAYAEAASLTRYLIATSPHASLGSLLARLAAGQPFREAFKAATGTPLADFERAWLSEERSVIAAQELRKDLAVALIAVVGGLAILLLLLLKRKGGDDGDSEPGDGYRHHADPQQQAPPS
jgi:hypothetical protein